MAYGVYVALILWITEIENMNFLDIMQYRGEWERSIFIGYIYTKNSVTSTHKGTRPRVDRGFNLIAKPQTKTCPCFTYTQQK